MSRTLFTSNFKRITRIIIFLLIVGFLFLSLEDYISKQSNVTRRWKTIYNEEPLDMVFFGDSHANKTFRTDLYTENGLSSAIVSGSKEQFPSTYYNMLEVIEHNEPDIIVIELNSLFLDVDFEDDYLMKANFQNISGMKMGKNKINLFKNCLRPDYYVKTMFPQIYFHDNWKSINKWKENYEFNQTEDLTRGYVVLEKTITDELWAEADPFEDRKQKYDNYTGEKWEISQENLDYFTRVIDICNQKGIELIFVKAPVVTKDWLSMHKTLEWLEDEYNVEIIDYNVDYDLKLQKDDFYDIEHLSVAGSNIVSEHFLNEILIKKYGLVSSSTSYDSIVDILGGKGFIDDGSLNDFVSDDLNVELTKGEVLNGDVLRISGGERYSRIRTNFPISYKKDHVFYARASFSALEGNYQRFLAININNQPILYEEVYASSNYSSIQGEITQQGEMSLTFTNDQYGNEAQSVCVTEVNDIILIDLTATFGAGKEPTKDIMDIMFENIDIEKSEYKKNRYEIVK